MTKKSTNNSIISSYMNLVYSSNEIIKTFPKTENYGIIKEIKNSLYKGLKILMYTENESNKEEYLNLINELDIIKILFEISYKSQYTTLDNYNKIENLIKNIPIKTGELQ